MDLYDGGSIFRFKLKVKIIPFQGDIFSGLNDGILSRAEALADIGKHQSSHAHTQMSTQLKHDVMYHHSMGGPPQRPLQVSQNHYQQIYYRFDKYSLNSTHNESVTFT